MTTLTKKSNKKEYFLGVTLSALSKDTKVDIATWSKWLNGTRSPNLDSLRELAILLEMPLMELIEAFEERRSRTIQRKQSE
jgi:transcriptional regulator with XRE-family HTH domain